MEAMDQQGTTPDWSFPHQEKPYLVILLIAGVFGSNHVNLPERSESTDMSDYDGHTICSFEIR
ncbi:hypothetical protein CPB83DRAFT_851660 [Crepidotus variabilis]|uniref:Uncharacterized protein n=1 Tax=Crepidotus variabilis TaxID=179855 RepID=A0A9P6EJK6_9AGAR|nr:hypothetical protein CPB83DRAFT_851660 [Crepidotus variabilis]